jgi:three-Cys-motif partner protein
MLVERDAVAYQRLATVPAKYPDITIKTYEADFISAVPSIERDIPADAFAFFLIDPKGWRIPLMKLRPILARQKSEVIFNFMFDFINRAASMKDAAKGLGELIPYGDWHARLIEDEYPVSAPGPLPRERKQILVGAFRESLRQIGGYEFVVEMPVLRPFKDRELYYLCYATRHAEGIKVFRDCQVAALNTESKTRAAVKVQHAASTTGQSEMFESLHDMGPDKVTEFLESERKKAVAAILDLVPKSPDHIEYRKLWPVVLSNHAVRFTDVNAMCAKLRKEEILHFPDWERNKRVPQDHYRAQRIK